MSSSLASAGPLEGDVVEALTVGERWVDLKYGPDANYSIPELLRAELALRDGRIEEFIVSPSAGSSPPGDWMTAMNEINLRLPLDKNPIRIVPGETLP